MIRTEDYMREFVQICFAQKRIIIGTTILFTLAAAVIWQFYPPTFAADGSLLVKGNRVQVDPGTLENVQARVMEITMRELNTEKEMLLSPDVVGETIKRMAEQQLFFTEADTKGDALKEQVGRVQGGLTTEILPETSVLKVRYMDKNPQRALKILENLFIQYIGFHTGVYSPASAEGFFNETAKGFDTELKAKEDLLVQLARDGNTANPIQEIESNMQLRRMLEQQLDTTRSLWIEKDLFVKHLRDVLASQEVQFYAFIENESIRLLGEKVQTLVLERGQLLRIYSETSEKVRRVDEHVKSAYAALKSEVVDYTTNQETQLNTLRDQIESLEVRLEEINTRNLTLQETVIANQRVQREADLLKLSYDTFARRREEARISGSGGDTLFSVSVLSRPFFTGAPVFPRSNLLFVGALVGLITGFSLGFLREYFDHTFKKPEDVAKFADLPTIMSIPNWNVK
ncbi:GumC family protein [Megalodesulfovibrio gigas]|uniref:Putative lipopolysaccharide biosynthesis protein n=1 Tax=Megalodesulfovibrio gigas (strain ATCC 19364 / DSM 1382 / NCIMB 9332 / VKM B-1759) TaxID=1121448 RepID=T2GBR2_MEGG1|nr:Wzz/FepE/Etk N-terminal domain-containing protein [Megalodesulfovibrio gigas]AGW13738.1 putative lipopolysaccharide biosynthesis protein [Megalodesulfovibrio gigas DSM 1382 = ATCC 19364]